MLLMTLHLHRDICSSKKQRKPQIILEISQMKKKGWTVFHTNQLNGSYSNFIQYHVAIVGNLDTILNNLGIHEEVIMHVTSSLTSKKYSGQISKISEDKAKKELWSFVLNQNWLISMMRMVLQQPRKSWANQAVWKRVAKTLNNHCDSAKLFTKH